MMQAQEALIRHKAKAGPGGREWGEVQEGEEAEAGVWVRVVVGVEMASRLCFSH
jgi:hypothetical protein